MQKVAAYLVERRKTDLDAIFWENEKKRSIDLIMSWLINDKRAQEIDKKSGKFNSEDGTIGEYFWENAKHKEKTWDMIKLTESNNEGRQNCTSISVTNTGINIIVYVTIEAGYSQSTIKPISIDPRCPRVIRKIVDLPGGWYHGTTQIEKLKRATGFQEGSTVADQILDPNRTLPIIIVSQRDSQTVFQDIEKQLSYDLIALANVIEVDKYASWSITDSLGKDYSCFDGGIRVYWPKFKSDESPYIHPLWTAKRLLTFERAENEQIELFRKQLRLLHTQASAVSVIRPATIDTIIVNSRKEHFELLLNKAVSGSDYKLLAQDYADENTKLTSRIEELNKTVEELRNELSTTKINVEILSKFNQEHQEQSIAPQSPDDLEIDEGPKSGEVRYYKKIYSKPSYDVMELIGDCGCNNWENANKADKAKKGIERFENRKNWKSVKHCASCKGGGVWKVIWE